MTKLDKAFSAAISALRTEDWPLDAFIAEPSQIARHDDPEKIRLFSLDLLANGQLHAVSATEDRRLISGHGRLLAARAAGLMTLKTNVFPASISRTQFALIRASENFQRNDLTAFERWTIGRELMELNPDWQMQDLAAHLHLSPGMISKLMSPSKCVPAVQDALKAGKVPLATVYDISKVPHEQQAGLLALRLGGASAEQMAKAARKPSAKPHTTVTVKLSRVKLPLPDGAVVAVSASGEVDTAGLLEILDATREAVKKADKDHLDVATLARVMQDQARASKGK